MDFAKRTEYCGNFSMKDVGKKVAVCGWVQRQRDLGKLIFIDVRDRTGIVQLSFGENTETSIFKKAFSIRAEYVISAVGIVKERSSKNKLLKTGDIEIEVTELYILSKSETPPFEITEDSNVHEELRLKYRYLDLRRPDLQSNIIKRHRIVKHIRDYFDKNGFIEIETPMLIKSTPEGARDYVVPSRVFTGEFFALPQSPQLYKQLCMVSGFDRYMQVAKCFRDEDLRADRQPEFTQIDFEMSFVNKEDVMNLAEGLIQKLYESVLDINIELPLKRMAYQEAMQRFGSDKPDLRFGMELIDLTQELKNTEFRVFKNAIKTGAIKAINAKGLAGKFTRKEIDKLAHWVKSYGAKGLAFTKWNTDGSISSSYEKFLSEDEIKILREKTGAQQGDLIFIVASEESKVVYDTLGALRCEVAKKCNLINNSQISILWVTDFPLFEYDNQENRYVSKHHPFTMPNRNDIDKLDKDPLSVRSNSYDLVINGNEIGGGSERITDSELQNKIFSILGLSQEDISSKFDFLIKAFLYGAPPHAGMAFGLDRLIMIMLNCETIRDVIAFPKVASSAELMTSSPSRISQKQLDELAISTVNKLV